MTAEAGDGWRLTLYVSGASPRSLSAVDAVRRLCDDELPGADLEIVDLTDEPELSAHAGVTAAPTLVRWRPAPLCRVVGDLADRDRLRRALGIDDEAPDHLHEATP